MENTNKCKTNKIKSIPLILILVSITLIIILTIFSFNIYATYNNESENQNITTDTNKKNNNIISENILQVILNIEETNNEEQTISAAEGEVIENNEVITQNNNINTEIKTAANGEKYSIIGNLNIPSLRIQYPILSSTSEALLKISVNKYWGVNPNEVGNMVILGHNYKDSRFFGKLVNIQKGAVIQVTDSSGRTLDYKVYETGIIDPYDTACTSQLTNGHTDVTLITCYYVNGNAHATKRFYAKARAN